MVFYSDLQRARDTAKLAWDGMYEILPDARLRECNYGTLNGASSEVVEPLQATEALTKPFPDGESYEDVKARMADFLKFLKHNYDGKHVAEGYFFRSGSEKITHGHTMRKRRGRDFLG